MLERINLEDENRKYDGYTLSIEGDEEPINFNTVEDLEEFISHYQGELLADSRYDYKLHEWSHGTWLEIKARPRLFKGAVKIEGTRRIYEAWYDPDECGYGGWLNPYFELSEALKMAETMKKQWDKPKVSYDEKTDTFTYFSAEFSDYPEKYQGVDINGMHLYPIGGEEGWAWVKARKRKKA